MKLFVLNNQVVKDIVNSLTIEDKIKDIILNVIHRYDYSLVNFIYSMFSVYTTYYANLLDENSHISYIEAQQIFKELSSRTSLEIDRSNVFVADVYDILFTQSCSERSQLKGYFYEDTYSRLVNIIGINQAHEHMEEIFDALKDIFCMIEQNLIYGIIQKDDYNGNIILYLELTAHGLMIYVI